ncbi:MAG: GIY-YIG nuclease family protein [Reyranellaceae bacterium]
MKHEDRKAAIAAYKERKVAAGVFVVRCAATGQRWAGCAPDLATIWNRLSFSLRQGGERHPSLQTAWRDHGADSFSFDIVERVDAEELTYGRDQVLRDRRDRWCESLRAEAI